MVEWGCSGRLGKIVIMLGTPRLVHRWRRPLVGCGCSLLTSMRSVVDWLCGLPVLAVKLFFPLNVDGALICPMAFLFAMEKTKRGFPAFGRCCLSTLDCFARSSLLYSLEAGSREVRDLLPYSLPSPPSVDQRAKASVALSNCSLGFFVHSSI